MKCPNCGKWNQASMPHCVYCGAPLEEDHGYYTTSSAPAWQGELKDTPKTYVWVDESGQAEETEDSRD